MNEAFSAGDMVAYTGTLVGKTQQCKVIRVMPVENPQSVRTYRIRDSGETFDRAVHESTLTRIEPTASDLIFKL